MKKTTFIKASIPLLFLCSTINVSCGNNDTTESVHIFSINDIHGAACGYGDEEFAVQATTPGILRLANALNDQMNQSPNSMIVSAGDNNSGDVFSSSQHGESMFPVLKAMQVRYSAVGNHEFDWEKTIGLNGLVDNGYLTQNKYDNWGRTSQTQGHYFIAANILQSHDPAGNDLGFDNKQWSYDENSGDYLAWKNNKVKWADPYKIVDLGGLKVCLIGLTTVLTRTDGNKSVTVDYSFIDYNASVVYAKKLCKEEDPNIFDEIDSFVLLTHVDADMNGDQVMGECKTLAESLTTKVDAIISGHSHKVVCGQVENKQLHNKIWVGQAGSSGKNYLDLSLTYSPSAAKGKKFVSAKMKVEPISIAGSKEKDIELAKREIVQILQKTNDSTNRILIDTKKVFDEQRKKVLENLSYHVFESSQSDNRFNLDYSALINSDIGHQYYCPTQIVDKMGMWLAKAFVGGCNIYNELFKDDINDEFSNKTAVSMSFFCLDSIRSQIQNANKISKLNLYQLLSYDNFVYKGWLTISQLWNILDYALSGGWPNDNKVDSESAFAYGTKNRQYDWVDKIETNRFTGEKEITLPINQVAPDQTTKLNYLTGPLQFYGCKCVVKEAPVEDQTFDGNHTRKYIVDYTEEEIPGTGQSVKIPKLWLYDPSDSDNQLDDPTTWKKVTVDGSRYDESKNEWNYLDDLVPIVVDSFTYGGGNYQNTMFKEYMQLNAKLSVAGRYQIFVYPTGGEFYPRDFVAKYCEYWNQHQAQPTFDFDKFACNSATSQIIEFI